MCGIIAYLGSNAPSNIKPFIKQLEARGPEGSNCLPINNTLAFGFTRLAINGLTNAGMQPFQKGSITWMCNGEIYNSKDLQQSLGLTTVGSDCECIGDLYLRHRDDLASFARALDGVFAIALYDDERKILIVTRDPHGIRPLFISSNSSALIFASEMKAMPCSDTVKTFPPGYVQTYNINTLKPLKNIQYYSVPWITNPQFRTTEIAGFNDASVALRFALEEAVRKRMLTDRPVAALLSGGLDSSLIAALVQRNLNQTKQPPLKTFSIGFQGSSDLAHARIVADWIKSDHTEIIMTPDEFFDAIPTVIQAIESYDTTTVRASTGNYLIAKKIRELTDCKVVFNGDGADELCGGYLYMHKAPNDLHEIIRFRIGTIKRFLLNAFDLLIES